MTVANMTSLTVTQVTTCLTQSTRHQLEARVTILMADPTIILDLTRIVFTVKTGKIHTLSPSCLSFLLAFRGPAGLKATKSSAPPNRSSPPPNNNNNDGKNPVVRCSARSDNSCTERHPAVVPVTDPKAAAAAAANRP